jgi:hypothetical protein
MREFQNKLLEALLSLESSELPSDEGDWYLISDSATRIKEKYRESSHPGFILTGDRTSTSGYVEVWIRSTTTFGEMPQWLNHNSHFHDRTTKCSLDKDGWVGVGFPRKIGAYNLRNLVSTCHETDQIWLRSFHRCLSECRGKK